MKTLLAVIVTAAICYVFFKNKNAPDKKTEPPVAAETPRPPKSHNDEQPPARAGASPRTTLDLVPPGAKIEKFWGHIVQHMGDGKLLMQTNHGRVVVRLPGELSVPDGTYIPKFNGAIIGTYRYATTDGATRDVWDVVHLPDSWSPPGAPTPQPGAWRLEKAQSTLGTPAKGTRSTLTDQQRMAEWAKQVQGSR